MVPQFALTSETTTAVIPGRALHPQREGKGTHGTLGSSAISEGVIVI
jgi:hypothetical protein